MNTERWRKFDSLVIDGQFDCSSSLWEFRDDDESHTQEHKSFIKQRPFLLFIFQCNPRKMFGNFFSLVIKLKHSMREHICISFKIISDWTFHIYKNWISSMTMKTERKEEIHSLIPYSMHSNL